MTREQLEHVIRAAAANADVSRIAVIGSQAILGSFPDLDDPVLNASMEADVFPLDAPERSILIDGAIGERSVFHETFGYYAHGVGSDTAVLPSAWQDRLIEVKNENTKGASGLCLDPHDLAISKLVAGREKDLQFVHAMHRLGLLDPKTLTARLASTPRATPAQRALVEGRIRALQAP